MKVGDNLKIKEFRKLKGYTQQQLADMLGIERSAYTRKEIGDRRFSIEEAFILEKYLEISIYELFDYARGE